MHSIIVKIENAFKNPWLEAALGIVIMATGLAEAGESLFEDVASGEVGAHHGVIILGLVHTIKAVPSILGGLIIMAHSSDREQK